MMKISNEFCPQFFYEIIDWAECTIQLVIKHLKYENLLQIENKMVQWQISTIRMDWLNIDYGLSALETNADFLN